MAGPDIQTRASKRLPLVRGHDLKFILDTKDSIIPKHLLMEQFTRIVSHVRGILIVEAFVSDCHRMSTRWVSLLSKLMETAP